MTKYGVTRLCVCQVVSGSQPEAGAGTRRLPVGGYLRAVESILVAVMTEELDRPCAVTQDVRQERLWKEAVFYIRIGDS